jgi:hypothetical protein
MLPEVCPSYKNQDYLSLENEQWLPLHGLDDYFYISNLGRVKSLDRFVPFKNGKLAFYKGRIYKAQIIKHKNNTKGDYSLELKVGFYYQGKSYSIRVARKVYELFIAPIPVEKAHYYVLFKDGNNLNCHASNLQLVSPHEKMYIMYHNNRCRPIFTFITSDSIKKNAQSRLKPVTQFSKHGLPIAKFRSVKAAAANTGLSESSIVAALKGRSLSSGGYLWQYGTIDYSIDTTYYIDFISKSGIKNQYTNI